jgi:uncharacterized membrane protein
MATATNVVTHLYESYDHATSVVRDLEAAGVPAGEISVIANNEYATNPEPSGAATGAAVGTTVGAGAGLLAGLGLMAIPGIGPVVAAGWLASTALGAAAGLATGGILGALTDVGVTDDHAHVYAEGIRRGSTLVSVRSSTLPRSTIVSIMGKYGPVDPDALGAQYRKDGWERFEERADAVPLPRENRPLR